MIKFQSIIFTILSLLLISCNQKKETGKNVFTLNLSQNIETLEPVMSNSNQSIWGLALMMEGLVEYDKQNNLIPCIAKSWTISEDGLTYTFTLRNDVYFHDSPCFKLTGGKGRKVTASDFKYCMERVNNPKTKTRGSWVFRDRIKGAQEYIDFMSDKSNSEVTGISGLKAYNDSTLVIELTKPFSPFLSILTMSYGYVYPKE
ncbi:MAG: ABC transporter substrate-binding protein, partial [Ignavibacteria bacterium]